MASKETISISKQEYDELKRQIAELSHELAKLKRMLFGKRSEKFIQSETGQTSLFEIEPQAVEEEPREEITYTRKKPVKKQPLRTELPAHLKRVSETIEPENLPEGAKKIGELITEVLEYKPADIFVRQIIRPKYVIKSDDEQTAIRIAELPSLPIPKGNAGAGLIAQLIVSKFVDHLPFYRQRQIFKRQDLDVAESTLGGWFNAGCQLLEPLYDKLVQKVLDTDYLMADESPMPVQTKDKAGATHKGYQWVYYDPVRRLVLFDYRKSRGREGPREVLKDFKGYLQTDGYSVYDNLKSEQDVTLLACMAHARRKFDEAKNNDKARAEEALRMFADLYQLERQARDQQLDHTQRQELRQKESLPILEKMKAWLDKNLIQVAPKSAIGIAIQYTLNLWSRLERYTEQGRFEIDNNLIENTIRPLALGRKNYLFAGSHNAARQAAIVYSLMSTCKQHNIEPWAWLRDTLTKLPDHPANKLHELLPGYQE